MDPPSALVVPSRYTKGMAHTTTMDPACLQCRRGRHHLCLLDTTLDQEPCPCSDDGHEPNWDDLDRFIASVEWVYAKTVPEHPHWYCVRAAADRAGHGDAWLRMLRACLAFGWTGRAYGRPYKYLTRDGWDYWVGPPYILNRRRHHTDEVVISAAEAEALAASKARRERNR